MFSARYSELEPLADDVDGLKECEGSQTSGYSQEQLTQRRRRPHSGWVMVAILVVLFLSSNILSIWVGAHLRTGGLSCSDAQGAADPPPYSIIDREIGFAHHTERFNSSFLFGSAYRDPGSPEVDALWDDLGVNDVFRTISVEEGLRSGLTMAHAQLSEKYGGGFIVEAEGVHNLHCLNLIRQSLYFNYDYYKNSEEAAFKLPPPVFYRHVTHCVDYLRELLMCDVSTVLLGQIWFDPAKPEVFPDFNPNRQCRNYTAVRDWQRVKPMPTNNTDPEFLKKPTLDQIVEWIP